MSKPERGLTYSEVGVDVDIEAMAARILYGAAKESWVSRKGLLGEVFVPNDSFSGIRGMRVHNLLYGTIAGLDGDGNGTKPEVAERLERYDTAAYDLMAMVCDDAAVKGAEPILVSTNLIVNTLGQNEDRLQHIREIAKGYVAAAKEANVAIISGEIAQHSFRMAKQDSFSFDWSGTTSWFADESRFLTGEKVRPGDYIIGCEEPSFRTNGLSLPQRVLREEYEEGWHNAYFNGKRIGDILLQPARVYTPIIVDMTGGWDLKREPKAELTGAVHISGGGIPEKLGRFLKDIHLGAVIDDPFTPNPLMLHCQKIGKISDREAYKTWNMGQGAFLIAREVEDVMAVAKEHNLKTKIVGQITDKPGITIHGKGIEQKIITFP